MRLNGLSENLFLNGTKGLFAALMFVFTFTCLFFTKDMKPVMDGWMDDPLETFRGSGDHDGVDVTSWVSVCPRGLWKVQKKQTDKGSQHPVSISGDDACMLFLLSSLIKKNNTFSDHISRI